MGHKANLHPASRPLTSGSDNGSSASSQTIFSFDDMESQKGSPLWKHMQLQQVQLHDASTGEAPGVSFNSAPGNHVENQPVAPPSAYRWNPDSDFPETDGVAKLSIRNSGEYAGPDAEDT